MNMNNVHPERTVLREYKIAVALGNIGASLLERGDYVRAEKTIKDAISAFKVVLDASDPAARVDSAAISIEEKLHEASRVAARPCPMLWTRKEGLVVSSLSLARYQIDKNTVKTVLELPPSMLTGLPIRSSDVSDADGGIEEWGVQLESAVMLYNLALATYHTYEHDGRSEETGAEKAAQTRCLNLFKLAATLLNVTGVGFGDDVLFVNILMARIVVLFNFGLVLREFGLVTDADICDRDLLQVRAKAAMVYNLLVAKEVAMLGCAQSAGAA